MSHVFKFFFLLVIVSLSFSCSHKTAITKTAESHVIVNDNKIDSAIYKAMYKYKKVHDEQMYAVIAKSEGVLIKADIESTLGNFFCDAVIHETKKLLGKDSVLYPVAIFNKGGLRNSLPKGNITIGNVFELMPFENELLMVKISGAKFKEMCSKIIEKGGIPIGGMTMEMKGALASNVKINGQPFDETKSYWVVTSDYLGNGGDGYNFFKEPLDKRNMKVLLRNVIISYCEELTRHEQTIKPKLDGRISISK